MAIQSLFSGKKIKILNYIVIKTRIWILKLTFSFRGGGEAVAAFCIPWKKGLCTPMMQPINYLKIIFNIV
jgi:hypothetical protein